MLSKDTYARLKSALTRKALADEFQALVATPGVPSEKLAAQILNMMARKSAANELISALSTAGHQVLSLDAQRRFRNAMCRKAAASEILDQI